MIKSISYFLLIIATLGTIIAWTRHHCRVMKIIRENGKLATQLYQTQKELEMLRANNPLSQKLPRSLSLHGVENDDVDQHNESSM